MQAAIEVDCAEEAYHSLERGVQDKRLKDNVNPFRAFREL